MASNNAKRQANILAAHEANDAVRLCELYAEASSLTNNIEEACFFATYAYVFALQSGHHLKEGLHNFLKQHGREE